MEVGVWAEIRSGRDIAPRGATMVLEKELETYRAKLPEWSAEEGKFALIHGETVVDIFTSYEDALKRGYQEFGLEPFLVKQIQAIEQVHFISRFVDPYVQSSAE